MQTTHHGDPALRFVQLLMICLFASLWTSGEKLHAQRRLRLLGHNDARQIRDLAFSPDGKLLASASDDGTVHIWEAITGKSVATLNHDGAVKRLAFSLDGRLLATSYSTQNHAGVRIWHVESWQGSDLGNLMLGHARDVNALAFSPDGKRLVTAAGAGGGLPNEVKLWDPTTRKEIAVLRNSDTILDVGFSPDGKLFAAVGIYGVRRGKGAVIIWRTDAFDAPQELRNEGHNSKLVFSPNSQLLAVGTRLTARDNKDKNKVPCRVNLWQLEGAKLVDSLPGFVGNINTIAISPDSQMLVASATLPGGFTTTFGEVVGVLNVATGARRVLERNTHSRSIQFSPIGGLLATSFTTPRPGVRVWDARSGHVLTTLEQGKPRDVVMHIRYSPQGDKLAVANLSPSGIDPLCIWFLAEQTAAADDRHQ